MQFIVHFLSCSSHMATVPLQKATNICSNVPVLLIAISEGLVKARCCVPKHNVSEHFNAESWMHTILPIFQASGGPPRGQNPHITYNMKGKKIPDSEIKELLDKSLKSATDFAALNTHLGPCFMVYAKLEDRATVNGLYLSIFVGVCPLSQPVPNFEKDIASLFIARITSRPTSHPTDFLKKTQKVEFKGNVPAFMWRESGKQFRKNPQYAQPRSNSYLPVFGSLIYCEKRALDHAATEAGAKFYPHLRGGRVENRFENINTFDQDSNLNLPIIDSLVYCKSSALDHVATEVGGFI
uniref:(California timema) hypothetical protein n=1 Tax=Timema californicum TaxID=61474 RepID=A0A7R9P862_TIMCA|nr:unnamed protein product [Timema californicum]